MKTKHLTSMLALVLLCAAISATAEVVEHDPQYNFSVSRPSAWYHQEKPSSTIRVMLGVEGDWYGGNCNISVITSPSTALMSQAEVDVSENKRDLGTAHFQSQLSAIAPDMRVLSVVQTRRGQHYGHLVNYTYSYVSQAVGQRIFIRAEVFSHSRPGKNFAFTCNTAALTQNDAQRAFSQELASFERFSESLRLDP